eukprot:TRINITY_DN33486_c0_g1_i1.p1 TRINITY_DN33486_c0_g1~~TRINITY_DN33486_c0_g1_i1.p1  ORF type:complete len:103 (+),score=1.93 TRINITY_DN33486_c0_g1_i1:356-664(+)
MLPFNTCHPTVDFSAGQTSFALRLCMSGSVMRRWKTKVSSQREGHPCDLPEHLQGESSCAEVSSRGQTLNVVGQEDVNSRLAAVRESPVTLRETSLLHWVSS